MGGVSQAADVYFCDIDSLATWCQQLHTKKDGLLWKHIKVTSPRSCSASFGNHLVSIGGGGNRTYSSSIVALSPLTRAWVHVGDLPMALCDATCTVIQATQNLVVIGGRTAIGRNARVYKASLRGKIKIRSTVYKKV